MKFAVGYQMLEGDQLFSDIVMKYREHIDEVYFPWIDTPTGRSPLASQRGHTDWEAQEKLEYELNRLHNSGLKLDILFNANCYGSDALSLRLSNYVCSILEHLRDMFGGVDIVTTTSPAIAHTVKQSFPDIEVRASVNMRIGHIEQMQYLSRLFDSFYIQRDYNRDFDRIRELKAWADANGKKMLMLANSGCLRFCSGQTFHDNLVAHEKDIAETVNIPDFISHVCWNYYKSMENWASVLQNTWVRPEDLHNYEPYFSVVKLATRMHALPEMVIQSYVRQRYFGNLLDLFEPGYGPVFAPYVIDNSKFPGNWFEVTSKCNKKCHECHYCRNTLKQVLVNTEGA